ncbi:Thioredoxin domain-containing protein 5 [Phlyctochytrium bullatum]|nr:Thioredoxin domain-containing protein 5 [Phlyctochytrium bullatum]
MLTAGRPFLLLLLLLLLLVAILVQASPLSDEEKKERRLKADEANKSIRHIPQADVKDRTRSGVWLLMFGAVWCPFTQKATPKWLDFQTAFDAKHDKASSTYNIGKVECSENEDFCSSQYKVDGYPTMLLIVDGAIREEYLGDEDGEPMLAYFEAMKTKIDNEKSTPFPSPSSSVVSSTSTVSLEPTSATPEPTAVKSAAQKNAKVEVLETPVPAPPAGDNKKAVVGGSVAATFLVAVGVVVGAVAAYRYRGRAKKKDDNYRSIGAF